jgi:hypothetical protein
LEILSVSEEIGIVEACRKYNVIIGTFTVGRKGMRAMEKQA